MKKIKEMSGIMYLGICFIVEALVLYFVPQLLEPFYQEEFSFVVTFVLMFIILIIALIVKGDSIDK